MKIKKENIILIILTVCFTLLMIPLVYCSFFNYATGDDLNQSCWAHQVYVNHGSVSEFLDAAFHKWRLFYNGWGGNWSACLLWIFQPSIWGENIYHITFYLSAFFIYGGFGYLGYYWYQKSINGNKKYFYIILIALFIVFTEGVPNGNTAFYWYSVFANYIVSFGLMLATLVWLDKYIDNSRIRYIIISSLALIFIGGAGYMTLVVSLEMMILFLLYAVIIKKAYKKALVMLIPFAGYLISTIMNVKAPGNMARGGATIDFGIGNIISVILGSIVRGTVNVGHYFNYCRILFLYVPLLILFAYYAVDTKKYKSQWIGAKIVLGFLIYCSSYAPMVMMKDIVASSGHTNSYWMLFVIWLTYSVIGLVGYIKLKFEDRLIKLIKPYEIGCILLVIASLVMYRHFIGNMFSYTCYDYIKSGRLADFEEQMQERFYIFNNTGEEDVVVPYMNWNQGPFLHFAITDDVNEYTNEVTADFYGKKSVLGMPREQYYEQYGHIYPGK